MKMLILALFLVTSSYAYETDQYSVSKKPLKDLGPQLSLFIYQNLHQGIDEVNQQLKELPRSIALLENELTECPQDIDTVIWVDHPARAACLELKNKIISQQKLLNQLHTDFGVVTFLHEKYALTITWNEQRDGVFGLPLSYANLDKNEKYQELYFNQGKLDTIYSFAGFHRIISPSYFVFASTINAYGTYMGVDKFGHFINQGYEYFQLYNEYLKQGLDREQSLKKIVQWGVDTEDGLFGRIVDGVYSNADLAANFSGFVFYQNFLKSFSINNQLFPRILSKKADGFWSYNEVKENSKDQLLKRFISDHFDESLTASVYERPQRYFVAKAIEKRCQSWKSFYGLHNSADYFHRTDNLKNWYGFDYGYKSEGLIDIPSLCF